MHGPRPFAVARMAPIAMVIVLAVSWSLRLRWPSLIGSAVVTCALAYVATVSTVRNRGVRALLDDLASASGLCVLIVGVIGLGYAAYALRHPGVFGPITRLGYPLLVATGIRLPGGVCVILLCGMASASPLIFSADESADREHAAERVLPGGHFDPERLQLGV